MQFLSQNMFIIHVIDLSNKTKMEGRGFIFLQKSEKTDSWKKKKMYSSVISFQEFLIYPYMTFNRKRSMFRQSTPLIH